MLTVKLHKHDAQCYADKRIVTQRLCYEKLMLVTK